MEWNFRDIRKIFEQRGQDGGQLPVIGYVDNDGMFEPVDKKEPEKVAHKVVGHVGSAILTILVAIIGIALNLTGRWY